MNQSNQKTPRLTLVGAGPGDPELLTIKGLNALKVADVVLYDSLVGEQLLSYSSSHSQKIYVGKRPGANSLKQDEINELIVHYANEFGHVVRLKGGDPFVLGRGFEELEYAKKFNIPVDVVPGVSSCYSVAEYENMPVTYRGLSQSFWVISATNRFDDLTQHDLDMAAQSGATIVILMGIRKLSKIIDIFLKHNKHNSPISIIQKGTTIHKKILLGQVHNIVQRAEESGIGSPAVITIGEVVSLHTDFKREDI